jgi:amino acid transporter
MKFILIQPIPELHSSRDILLAAISIISFGIYFRFAKKYNASTTVKLQPFEIEGNLLFFNKRPWLFFLLLAAIASAMWAISDYGSVVNYQTQMRAQNSQHADSIK